MQPCTFRIRDFCSIVDSEECKLSADRITVLAGQNEAGKTAILSALRDFHLPIGESPRTKEYIPDGRYDVRPTVAVEFEVDLYEIDDQLRANNLTVPDNALMYLGKNSKIWVVRDLLNGEYILPEEISSLWPPPSEPNTVSEKLQDEVPNEGTPNGVMQSLSAEQPKMLSLGEFAAFLRDLWPSFVYFDSFQDSLPKDVTIDMSVNDTASSEGAQKRVSIRSDAPETVHDFILLSGLDLNFLVQISTQDKTLGRSALNGR